MSLLLRAHGGSAVAAAGAEEDDCNDDDGDDNDVEPEEGCGGWVGEGGGEGLRVGWGGGGVMVGIYSLG